jgi:hypothetical protein
LFNCVSDVNDVKIVKVIYLKQSTLKYTTTNRNNTVLTNNQINNNINDPNITSTDTRLYHYNTATDTRLYHNTYATDTRLYTSNNIQTDNLFCNRPERRLINSNIIEINVPQHDITGTDTSPILHHISEIDTSPHRYQITKADSPSQIVHTTEAHNSQHNTYINEIDDSRERDTVSIGNNSNDIFDNLPWATRLSNIRKLLESFQDIVIDYADHCNGNIPKGAPALVNHTTLVNDALKGQG